MCSLVKEPTTVLHEAPFSQLLLSQGFISRRLKNKVADIKIGSKVNATVRHTLYSQKSLREYMDSYYIVI